MAKRDFLVSLDLNKNELLNVVVQNLPSAPSAPVEGQTYYNTTDKTVYCWTGTAWLDLGDQGVGAGAELLTNKATTLEVMNDTLYPTVDALFQSREVTTTGAIVQSDNGGIVYLNSATPFNLTLNQLTAKTQVTLINVGTADVTLVNGSGVSFVGESVIPGGNTLVAVIYKTATAPLVLAGNVTEIQNAVGNILTDTSSIDFTYASGTPAISAQVIAIPTSNEASTTGYPVFVTASGTQTLAPKTNSSFSYSPSTNTLTLAKVNLTASSNQLVFQSAGVNGVLTWTPTSSTKTITIPDSTGTLALTSQIPSGAALTKTDDTNVTLTLGGSPSTALINAASLTLGWTGQLAVARGGTGTSNGSITGTGALTFTAGGTNTNINLVPNGIGTVDVASKRISNVASPTTGSDAANKDYVDATKQGLSFKVAARVATTGAETYTISAGAVTQINGTTIDGVSLAVGNRILIKNAPAASGAGAGAGTANTTQPANGIYSVLGNTTNLTLTRSSDADISSEVTAGLYVFVSEGTDHADSGFVLTTNDTITLNTTGLTFTQFSGAGQITAGDGMTKTGNTLNIVSHAGSAGTIGTINIGADAIGVNLGTTSTTAAAGNHNHDGTYPKKYATGTAASTVTTVTHNLGTRDVVTQIYDGSSYAVVEAQIVNTDTNTVTVTFNTATTANQYRIVVIG